MSGIDSSSEEFIEKQRYIYKSAFVTMILLTINIIVFVLSSLFLPVLYSKGAMYTAAVISEGEIYRILSAIFLHANVNHLFNNMIMLLLVGAIIENYVGHGLFAVIYILAGILGNLLSMSYEIKNDLTWVSVGASGAVMGLVGYLVVWIVINRDRLIKDKSMMIRLLLLLLFVVDACFFQEGANTVAHLGGFITGFVFGVINIIIFNNRKDMEGIA